MEKEKYYEEKQKKIKKEDLIFEQRSKNDLLAILLEDKLISQELHDLTKNQNDIITNWIENEYFANPLKTEYFNFLIHILFGIQSFMTILEQIENIEFNLVLFGEYIGELKKTIEKNPDLKSVYYEKEKIYLGMKTGYDKIINTPEFENISKTIDSSAEEYYLECLKEFEKQIIEAMREFHILLLNKIKTYEPIITKMNKEKTITMEEYTNFQKEICDIDFFEKMAKLKENVLQRIQSYMCFKTFCYQYKKKSISNKFKVHNSSTLYFNINFYFNLINKGIKYLFQ